MARAWHRALLSVGQKPMHVNDCRHVASTTWLRAGMPVAETARRLGHSIETLVTTYVGALDEEEHTANRRIDTYPQPGDPAAIGSSVKKHAADSGDRSPTLGS